MYVSIYLRMYLCIYPIHACIRVPLHVSSSGTIRVPCVPKYISAYPRLSPPVYLTRMAWTPPAAQG
jgi:hypothetical protein